MQMIIYEGEIELMTESAIEKAFIKKVLGLEEEGDTCVATRNTKPHGLISNSIFISITKTGKKDDGTS